MRRSKPRWQRTALRPLLKGYIGGGWGEESQDGSSSEPAAVIRGTDIPAAQVGNLQSVPLRFHKKSNLRSRKLQPGDVIFEVSGGSKDQPVGRALYCSDKLLKALGGDVIPASFCKRIEPDPEKIDGKFLYYFLKAIYDDRRISQWQVQSTGISNFQFEAFLDECEIDLPALDDQRRIASILSAYDDLIENNMRRIAILEEMARRIYEEWFVRFRFPGHEQVKMVESELGLIPKGWSWGHLRDIAYDVRDSVNPDATDPATPYVGLEHIPRRSMALSEWGAAEDVQSTKLKFDSGDILFGKIRPYFHKVAVAPVAGVASSDAIVIRAKGSDWFPIVLATVSSDAFVAEATQSSNGTKMPRANWNVLLGYRVAIPTNDVRGEFNALMNNVVAFIKNTTLRNRNLRATRDLLLPKLISGELKVPDLEIVDA